MQNCYVLISALKNFIEPVSVSVAQIVGIIILWPWSLLTDSKHIFPVQQLNKETHLCMKLKDIFAECSFSEWKNNNGVIP